MSPTTRPAARASERRTAGSGTRPLRTMAGTPAPVRAPRAPRLPRPFTLAHFRAWTSGLVLDSDRPFRLEPFQAAFVRDVLAGTPEVWDVVPEGNGKSTLIAVIALYYAEHRPLSAIMVAAASREQADIVYRQAEGFVLRTPSLRELLASPVQIAKGKRKTDVPRFLCLEGYRRIVHHLGGRIQIFAADDRTGDGVIPDLAIIDELHRQRDLGLYRTWSGKLSKRNGQIVAISTAGEPGSDFEVNRGRIRQQATSSRTRGAFTRWEAPGIAVHEWALPEGAAPDDFRAVKAANPFSGITAASLRAKLARPTMTMDHWLRFVCNRPTRGSGAAVEESEWLAARSPVPIPPGERVWVGLDVAWKWDTTAAVPAWEDGPRRVLGPAEVLVPPRDGTSLPPAAVKAALRRIHGRNPVDTIVMDMHDAADIAAWIGEEIGARVVDWPQSLGTQVVEFQRFAEGVRTGTLLHSGDAGLTGHVLNAAVRILPSGDPVFTRPVESRHDMEAQDRRVIDALKAAAMVNAALLDPRPDPEPASRRPTWRAFAA